MDQIIEGTRRGERSLRRALLVGAALFAFGGALAAPPAPVDDTVLAGAVRRALEQELGPSASAIWVEVYRGAVYLSGGVPSAQQQERAQRIAAGVHGVVSVKTEFDAAPPDTKVADR